MGASRLRHFLLNRAHRYKASVRSPQFTSQAYSDSGHCDLHSPFGGLSLHSRSPAASREGGAAYLAQLRNGRCSPAPHQGLGGPWVLLGAWG